MAEKKPKGINFDNFHKGIADYDYDGFVRMIGIYPFDPIGTATLTMPAQFDIGGYSKNLYTNTAWSWSAITDGYPIKPVSDGTYDGMVYSRRIKIAALGGAFYDMATVQGIIDALFLGSYFFYIANNGAGTQGLFAQLRTGGAYTQLSAFTFSTNAKMFSNQTGKVFILDNNKITILSLGYRNVAFNPADTSTYSLITNALADNVNNEVFISCASNSMYTVFGTQAGNIYSYNRIAGTLGFESNVHISDLPISILFESGNKIYGITSNLALIEITPSVNSTFIILKQGISGSRMPVGNGAPIAGFITDKFYLFWYNSKGQDDTKRVAYYDSGVLPTGVYAFTNPVTAPSDPQSGGKTIGRFCLSGLNPSTDTSGSINTGAVSFQKTSQGWCALNGSAGINPAGMGVTTNSLYWAVYTNRNSDMYTGYTPPKYNAQFDSAITGIGIPQAKEKMTHINVTFNGTGCPFKLSFRNDNNGDTFRNAYDALFGADSNGYIDLTGKSVYDQNFNVVEEVNVQLRCEFLPPNGTVPPRNCKVDSINIE